jgi:hypothetical protein
LTAKSRRFFQPPFAHAAKIRILVDRFFIIAHPAQRFMARPSRKKNKKSGGLLKKIYIGLILSAVSSASLLGVYCYYKSCTHTPPTFFGQGLPYALAMFGKTPDQQAPDGQTWQTNKEAEEILPPTEMPDIADSGDGLTDKLSHPQPSPGNQAKNQSGGTVQHEIGGQSTASTVPPAPSNQSPTPAQGTTDPASQAPHATQPHPNGPNAINAQGGLSRQNASIKAINLALEPGARPRTTGRVDTAFNTIPNSNSRPPLSADAERPNAAANRRTRTASSPAAASEGNSLIAPKVKRLEALMNTLSIKKQAGSGTQSKTFPTLAKAKAAAKKISLQAGQTAIIQQGVLNGQKAFRIVIRP